MKRYGLIGKNIQHSLSPEIYSKILGSNHQYDLLDYQTENLIPSPAELLVRYDGLNITSPYKKHFLTKVDLTPNAQKLKAINCLVKLGDRFLGENTDYLAIHKMLSDWRDLYREINVVILGEGVMSQVTQVALIELGLSFCVLSRKDHENFDQINILDFFPITSSNSLSNSERFNLVINCCSRDYVFKGTINNSVFFWDFNYNFPPHQQALTGVCQKYLDGYSMLFLQAKYAAEFWSKGQPF